MAQQFLYLAHLDGYGVWDVTRITEDNYKFIQQWWQEQTGFTIDCMYWDILPGVKALISGHDSLLPDDWESDLLSLLSENYLMDSGA